MLTTDLTGIANDSAASLPLPMCVCVCVCLCVCNGFNSSSRSERQRLILRYMIFKKANERQRAAEPCCAFLHSHSLLITIKATLTPPKNKLPYKNRHVRRRYRILYLAAAPPFLHFFSLVFRTDELTSNCSAIIPIFEQKVSLFKFRECH